MEKKRSKTMESGGDEPAAATPAAVQAGEEALPVNTYPPYVAERRLEFLAALGAAISQWQNIELWLSMLFGQALRSGEPDLAQIAFDSVSSFREKLRVLDAVLRAAMSAEDEYLTRWQKLQKKLGRLAQKRNRIAHGLTLMMPTETGIQFFSTPPLSKHREEAVDKAARLKHFRNTHQLQTLARAFALAADLTGAFAREGAQKFAKATKPR